MKLYYKLKVKVLCLIGWHEWTCKAKEGIPPTQEQLSSPTPGFWDYATTYCKNCGKELTVRK